MNGLGTGADRLIIGGIRIRHIQVNHRRHRLGPTMPARFANAHNGVPNPDGRPNHITLGLVVSLQFFGTECRLEKLDEPGGAGRMEASG